MATTPRILLSCIAKHRPDWWAKIENLVLSVRRFGGTLADAPVVANLVGGADPEVVEALDRLDAEVRIVDP